MVEGEWRSRCSREQWTRRVSAWRRSGLSAPEFCGRRGWSVRTLRWWAWKLGTGERAAEAAGLVPVEVEESERDAATAARAPFELALASGVVVRVAPSFDAVALGRLLDCLAERRRC
jgi:hypothetical protein